MPPKAQKGWTSAVSRRLSHAAAVDRLRPIAQVLSICRLMAGVDEQGGRNVIRTNMSVRRSGSRSLVATNWRFSSPTTAVKSAAADFGPKGRRLRLSCAGRVFQPELNSDRVLTGPIEPPRAPRSHFSIIAARRPPAPQHGDRIRRGERPEEAEA